MYRILALKRYIAECQVFGTHHKALSNCVDILHESHAG